MSRNWLFLGGLLMTWTILTNLPQLQKNRTPVDGVQVRFFAEPDLRSSSMLYEVDSYDLWTNYEYCNFYQVVLKGTDGEEAELYLYKKSEQLKELPITLRRTEGFAQKDCGNTYRAVSKHNYPRTLNPLDPEVTLQGIDMFRPVAPPRRVIVAPPSSSPPPPRRSKFMEGHHSAPGGGK
ncbi:MAG: hypothetical protein AAFN81_25405 [Bacteroidota bacterium]